MSNLIQSRCKYIDDSYVPDGRRVLFQFRNHGWIIKNPAWNLTVSSTKTQDQVKGGFLLDVVIAQSATVLQLLSRKDKTLLIRRNSLLVLDLGFDVVNGIGRLHIQRDGLTGQSFYENLREQYQERKRKRMAKDENMLLLVSASVMLFIGRPIEKAASV